MVQEKDLSPTVSGEERDTEVAAGNFLCEAKSYSSLDLDVLVYRPEGIWNPVL